MKEMLRHRRGSLSVAEWKKYVESIKNSIVNKPKQYLGPDLPSSRVIAVVIEDIFEEFVAETLNTKASVSPSI